MHISSKIYSLCRSCQFHRWQIYFLCPQTLDKRKSFHSVALLLVGNEIIRQETQSFPKNWENRFARVIFRNEEGMITRQSIDEQFIISRGNRLFYKCIICIMWNLCKLSMVLFITIHILFILYDFNIQILSFTGVSILI